MTAISAYMYTAYHSNTGGRLTLISNIQSASQTIKRTENFTFNDQKTVSTSDRLRKHRIFQFSSTASIIITFQTVAVSCGTERTTSQLRLKPSVVSFCAVYFVKPQLQQSFGKTHKQSLRTNAREQNEQYRPNSLHYAVVWRVVTATYDNGELKERSQVK